MRDSHRMMRRTHRRRVFGQTSTARRSAGLRTFAVDGSGRPLLSCSSARSDFHAWPGVAFLPLTGVERFRIGAVWHERREESERVRALAGALRTVARRAEPDAA